LANVPTSVLQNAGRSSGLRLDTNVFGPREHSTTSSSTHLAPALRRSIRLDFSDLRGHQLGCATGLLDAFGSDQECNRLAIQ